MKALSELFSESPKVSAMRVMSIACCITAIIIGILVVLKDKPDYSGASILCGVFLGAAFGGKVTQKSIETRSVTAVSAHTAKSSVTL